MMIERVNAEIRKQVAVILNGGLKDPRIAAAMVNVTEASTTSDLRVAKIYISFIGDDEKENDEILALIGRAAPVIRNELKKNMLIRNVPELRFYKDSSSKYAAKISKTLHSLNIPADTSKKNDASTLGKTDADTAEITKSDDKNAGKNANKAGKNANKNADAQTDND
ncbi:MAG: 30S ribosome-binding factor RbfA [Clostridiaceae bacterium]|jgi:ribosome-binding factor A|nr:30S ribosome-binding factor RbfA [Clostridiaceae bacterium]